MFCEERCINVIVATAVLHNICRANNLPLPHDEDEDSSQDEDMQDSDSDPDDGDDDEFHIADVNGINARANLIQNYFA